MTTSRATTYGRLAAYAALAHTEGRTVEHAAERGGEMPAVVALAAILDRIIECRRVGTAYDVPGILATATLLDQGLARLARLYDESRAPIASRVAS